MKRSATVSNPFITSVAGGSDFCDRRQELAELERLLRIGSALYSDRNRVVVGKSV